MRLPYPLSHLNEKNASSLQANFCEPRVISLADDEVQDCFRLRYHYFVHQRAWVAANAEWPGIERDSYDEHALHLGVWDEKGVAAYLRVLPFDPGVGFMLDQELACVLTEEERRGLPREESVELSRLVVRPDILARHPCLAKAHPVELLLKRLYQVSKERGFTRFYIVVEEEWLRPFARRFGLPFSVIGTPHVFPDGTKTVAATATLDELEAGMRGHSAAKYEWYRQ